MRLFRLSLLTPASARELLLLPFLKRKPSQVLAAMVHLTLLVRGQRKLKQQFRSAKLLRMNLLTFVLQLRLEMLLMLQRGHAQTSLFVAMRLRGPLSPHHQPTHTPPPCSRGSKCFPFDLRERFYSSVFAKLLVSKSILRIEKFPTRREEGEGAVTKGRDVNIPRSWRIRPQNKMLQQQRC